MSDLMRPIAFDELTRWMISELKEKNTIFSVKQYKYKNGKTYDFLDDKLHSPFGLAAGPHTQLAQNLITGYYAGARFFELKTVQILVGEQLGIKKPCIFAEDEGYNTEWSTELEVVEALNEYIKGWILCHVLVKEFGTDLDFVFNMSVGYDLPGITSATVDAFIEGMKDASKTECWQSSIKYLKDNLSLFKHVDEAFLDSISPNICNSIALSTLHGCPSDTIEEIAQYLLEVKKLNTFIKMNPTLLGNNYVREVLDKNGFDYIVYDAHHFEDDISFNEAVPMLKRLKIKAKELGLTIGVKLTNTFPVKTRSDVLEGTEMYMSGRSLFPLSIGVAKLITEAFGGDMHISYSGGANEKNIRLLVEAGIQPVTVSTLILQQGGYANCGKLARALEGVEAPHNVDLEKVEKLVDDSYTNPMYKKESHREKKLQPSFTVKKRECQVVCGSCERVCPNRANLVVKSESIKRLIHVDSLCNECGNCAVFCPYGYIPYRDKLTVFSCKEDFDNSGNEGFLFTDEDVLIRIADKEFSQKKDNLEEDIINIIDEIRQAFPYIILTSGMEE